jgi:hypothetical protein
VTVLCPGPVPTEFQARAGIASDTLPPLFTISAERVAGEGYRGLVQGRRLVVPGLANRLVTTLARFVPRKTLLAATARRQKGRHPLR